MKSCQLQSIPLGTVPQNGQRTEEQNPWKMECHQSYQAKSLMWNWCWFFHFTSILSLYIYIYVYSYIIYAICTFQVWSHVIDPDVFLYVNVIPLWFPTVDAIPFRQWLRLHVLKCHGGGSKGRSLDTNSSVPCLDTNGNSPSLTCPGFKHGMWMYIKKSTSGPMMSNIEQKILIFLPRWMSTLVWVMRNV